MRPVFVSGFAMAAMVVALAALGWLVFGAWPAIGVLVLGNLLVIAYHLWHLDRLTQWARGPADVAVPEARGPWQPAFAALYRRVRGRAAYQSGLANTIERFRSAADAVPDGMVVLDSRYRVRWANRRAQAFLALDARKDIGRPLANVVRHPDVVRYLDRADFSEAVLIESPREPGLMLSFQVIPFGEDERLLIARDVTKLEAVERMRRDFVANVSHELKTPLTVVSGFLETLRDLDVDEASRERYMQLMQDQARSMQRLVDDLLTLSALESNGKARAESTFAVAPLIAELVGEARVLSADVHRVVVEQGPTAQLLGNREELRSAFANLVSNAVRYTPAGGTVTIAWRIDDDGSGVFSVSDTGIGIAPEHIPRLTERFYRVDRSRSRATGGTGLGLAIVKHVLLRHDAELIISSQPGHGSTFAVRLPTHRVQAGVEATVPPVEPSISNVLARRVE
jgi:two-component system phosphate regulon sensor histidine kinase PhoR